jgi:uncharacterized protein (TIGR03435 family)
MPVYDLIVAKKGSLLKASKAPNGSSGTSSNDGLFKGQSLTLPELAQALTQELGRELGRDVIDKTGLTGRYDMTLKWTPETDDPSANSGSDNAATTEPGPSIFTAIQEQLGLKLESSKAPVEVLVIDHLEMPEEN